MFLLKIFVMVLAVLLVCMAVLIMYALAVASGRNDKDMEDREQELWCRQYRNKMLEKGIDLVPKRV